MTPANVTRPLARIHDSFRRLTAPGGRSAIQLTSGPGFCYPLYYYIPSITRDGRWVIHHRAVDGTVQLHRLDLWTGATEQLTHASSPDTWWRPWCWDAGSGVRDHLSVLDVLHDRVIWFDGGLAQCRDLGSGVTRDLFRLPDDRMPIGQACMSGDGRWFVYIHADRHTYEGIFADDPDYATYWSRRERCRDTRLEAFDPDTGEHRTLLVIASPIHHVLPYDERHLLFCHPTAEEGILLTDTDGGWYTHLRTTGEDGGQVCHFLGTARGVTYEVLKGSGPKRAGILDPLGRGDFELELPDDMGYIHTGRDPEGLLWLYEGDAPGRHALRFLERHDPARGDVWHSLTDHWPAFGDPDGQKAHHHPQVVLDRRWLLITAGDPAIGTNHLFLLDIADLEPTAGIADVRAGAGGRLRGGPT
jgi:hypothetical protein